MTCLGHLYSRLELIVDWRKIEKLRLQRVVISMLIFDFVFTGVILIPSSTVHFLYLSRAGRDGFVDKQWFNHVDIYQFRRFQPWELLSPVDWQVPRHVYINKTRAILDKRCSDHNANSFLKSAFGATGNYVKEVAGHPNRSGYNKRLIQMIRLWMTALEIVYFTSPLLLLGLWWVCCHKLFL